MAGTSSSDDDTQDDVDSNDGDLVGRGEVSVLLSSGVSCLDFFLCFPLPSRASPCIYAYMYMHEHHTLIKGVKVV